MCLDKPALRQVGIEAVRRVVLSRTDAASLLGPHAMLIKLICRNAVCRTGLVRHHGVNLHREDRVGVNA